MVDGMNMMDADNDMDWMMVMDDYLDVEDYYLEQVVDDSDDDAFDSLNYILLLMMMMMVQI